MGLVSCKCPSCSAEIQFDNDREFGYCSYCGAKVIQDKIVVEHRIINEADKAKNITEDAQTLLEKARLARRRREWSDVEKYYSLIEENDLQNIEAIFFRAYGKLRDQMLKHGAVNSDEVRCATEALSKSVSLVADYFDIKKESEQKQIIIDIVNEVLTLNSIQRKKELFEQIIKMLDNIISEYNANGLSSSYLVNLRKKVKKAKPDCYVATAVYGSYDCSQVWTLRRYRDDQLAKTWYGRLFIRTYYAVSPTLVKWFGNRDWFKKIWKPILDSKVTRLQKNGVENTPYEDKNW